MSKPGSDTFGNYMLHDLMQSGQQFHEISLPLPVNWWPVAPGWLCLGFLLLVWLGYQFCLFAKRWWRNRYRRIALKQIDHIAWLPPAKAAFELSMLLRAVALHVMPRQQVAALSGSSWLAFLASTTPGFDSQLGQRWLDAIYLPPERISLEKDDLAPLCNLARLWVTNHEASTYSAFVESRGGM